MAEDKRSHWQFLANLLGAESKTPEPEETHEGGSAAPIADAVPRPERPRRAERKAPAKPSAPADWSNIASNLGLQVEKPEPTGTSAFDGPPADQAFEAPPEPAAPTPDQPDAEEFPSTLPGFGVPRASSPPESFAASSPGEDRPHPVEPDPVVTFAEDVLTDPDTHFSDTAEFDSVAGEMEDDEPRPHRRSRRRRRRRRSEHGHEGGAPATRHDSVSDAEVDEPVEIDERMEDDEPMEDDVPMEDVGFGEPIFTDDEEEQEVDESRRPRRRRRRRRSSASGSREEAQHDSTTDERPTPTARDERSRRSRRPKRPAADVEQRDVEDVEDVELQRDDDDVGTLEREAEEDHPRPRRHVTSWPEAIEQVIAANLAHRSKSNGQGRRGRRPRDGDRNRNRGKRGD